MYPVGNVALDIGRYRLELEGEDGRVRDRGDHLLLWERTDGDWRVRSNVLYSRDRNGGRLPA
ncbi:MAG: DUF4440 domain-containing protein [Gemmatimonadota bacterium]|nr:DUF4440 domain-containing protein [Gemmatimonadota bacterium]